MALKEENSYRYTPGLVKIHKAECSISGESTEGVHVAGGFSLLKEESDLKLW